MSGAQPPAAFDTALVRQVRDIEQIAPSPDGARVAVVVSRSAAEGGGSDVWIASGAGSAAQKASSAPVLPNERATDPSWSADGSELFFRVSGRLASSCSVGTAPKAEPCRSCAGRTAKSTPSGA